MSFKIKYTIKLREPVVEHKSLVDTMRDSGIVAHYHSKDLSFEVMRQVLSDLFYGNEDKIYNKEKA